MDEILIRFPVIGQKIFKELDNKNLAKCRNVSKFWQHFLDNDSLLWKRRIEKYAQNQVKYNEDWKLVTSKVPFKILKKLAIAMEGFFRGHNYRLKFQYSPLHVVAEHGMVGLYKNIAERVKETNPANKKGWTPLHYAAENGHLKIVKYIAGHLEDKNPAMNDEMTPLFFAAQEGHLEIVKYIAEYLENKNPAMNDGETPLHAAAADGHLAIVKYIAEDLEDKNPTDENGATPLSLARENNHSEIVHHFEKDLKILGV